MSAGAAYSQLMLARAIGGLDVTAEVVSDVELPGNRVACREDNPLLRGPECATVRLRTNDAFRLSVSSYSNLTTYGGAWPTSVTLHVCYSDHSSEGRAWRELSNSFTVCSSQ